MNRAFIFLYSLLFILSPAWAASAQSNLYQAAERGDVTALRKALKAGADVDKQDSDGWTALLFAATKGHEETVRLLLSMGADPNRTGKKGETALIGAVTSENLAVVQALLGAGAKPDASMNNGQTAMDIARKINNQSIIELLQSVSDAGSLNEITVGLRINISSKKYSLKKLCDYAKSIMVDIDCYSIIDDTANPALRLEARETTNTINFICDKMTDEDIRIIISWLKSNGFFIEKVNDTRNDPLIGPFACSEEAIWVDINLNR